MQNSLNRPVPHEYNERRGSGHYPKHYDVMDQNNSKRSPTRNVMDLPVAQNHRQVASPEQYSPAMPDHATSNPRPPTYTGPPYEDSALPQQQQKRRGYRRTDSEEGRYQNPNPHPNAVQQSAGRQASAQMSHAESPSLPNQSMPVTRDQIHGSPPKTFSPPKSTRTESPDPIVSTARSTSIHHPNVTAGATIPRLDSPRVMKRVLQPLDGKVQEYSTRMQNAQMQMTQLDAEMAGLMEKRKQAEKRYMDAKTKYDDYRRQYQGVERAMKGEPGIVDAPGRSSYDDDEERPPTQPTSQKTSHQQVIRGSNSRTESWGSVKKPTKSGNRFSVSKFFGAS
ncbi:hypothetical protein PZA11_000187 [Diplocarpon coronariae]|uniref:Uncharacterized protein n=1 Tax=Diplocarpon coronariae TaxID=2795749 RepID=A0A218Z6L8_9HELO|nr:hypothetical protein B2J93_7199 [Marssonina coronariae]